MTITGLKKFIKDHYQKDDDSVPYEEEIPLSAFSGQSIAIDASLWLFKNFSTCSKNEIYSMTDFFEEVDSKIVLKEVDICSIRCRVCENLLSFIKTFLDFNTTPVFVWDGKSRPEKKDTQNKRQERQKKKDKLDEAIENLKTVDLKRYPTAIKEVRDRLAQTFYPTNDDKEYIIEFCKNLGIPNFIAPHDAEAFCASLSMMKKVSAVFSDDSDCIALSVDVILTELKYYKDGVPHFLAIYPSIIKKNLKLSESAFRDFCIMCGTDFNNNMPGIGPGRSYPLIKKYGSIEEILANRTSHKILNDKDFSILNYKKNRRFFTPKYYDIEMVERTIPDIKHIKLLFRDFSVRGSAKVVEKLTT